MIHALQDACEIRWKSEMEDLQMKIKLEIYNARNELRVSKEGDDELAMMWDGTYNDGDRIVVTAEKECFLSLFLDECLGYANVLYKHPFSLAVPFVEKKTSYSPRSFAPGRKYYRVRVADEREKKNYRNLAANPYDWHGNDGIFPHSMANVETRGEAVFASRNAMDGIVVSDSHGWYPYASWGINRNPKAEMHIDFGRKVKIDRVVFYNRADFPHDAWWDNGIVEFSDGTEETFHFKKTGEAQIFPIAERIVDSLTIKDLVKADDPSPFPALTQIEIWGSDL